MGNCAGIGGAMKRDFDQCIVRSYKKKKGGDREEIYRVKRLGQSQTKLKSTTLNKNESL